MAHLGRVVLVLVLVLALAACGGSPPRPASPVGNASADTQPALTAGTLRLEGQVVDDDGAPVAGAHVELATTPAAATTSEVDGFFALDDLAAGAYVIEARAADGRTARATVEVMLASEPVILRIR